MTTATPLLLHWPQGLHSNTARPASPATVALPAQQPALLLATLALPCQALLLATVEALAKRHHNLQVFLVVDDTQADPTTCPPLPADNTPSVVEDFLADNPYADALTEVEATLLAANAPPVQGLVGLATFSQATAEQQAAWLGGRQGQRHLLALQALRRHAMACAGTPAATGWLGNLPPCLMELGDPPPEASTETALPLLTLCLDQLALPKALQALPVV